MAVIFWWLGPLVGEFGPFAVLAAGFVAWFRFVYRLSPPQVPTPWPWTPSQWPPPARGDELVSGFVRPARRGGNWMSTGNAVATDIRVKANRM